MVHATFLLDFCMEFCLLQGFCSLLSLGIPGLGEHCRSPQDWDPGLPKVALRFCHCIFGERFASTIISSLLLKEQEKDVLGPGAGLGAGRKRTSSLEAERVQILILQSLVKGVPRGFVQDELKDNGLRVLWRGHPQHLFLQFKADSGQGPHSAHSAHTTHTATPAHQGRKEV